MSRIIGPKGHQFWHLSTGMRFRRFKWQWRVEYEYKHWSMNQEYFDWRHGSQIFESRQAARGFIRKPGLELRNVRISRRFIEVDWHSYTDSFRHNAGRGL